MAQLSVDWPQLFCALSCIALAPLVPGYSFRNCIQNANHNGSFQCVHRFLTQVSSAVFDLPPHTIHLNISHNLLTRLPVGSFSGIPSLLSLRLDYNQIKHVKGGAFSNLSQLLVLNLSYNKIPQLTPSDFLGLENLCQLLVDHNRLATVQPDAFTTPRSLQTLDMSFNELRNFSGVVSSIAALRKLTFLDLSTNHLESLQHSAPLPPSLQFLYLCNNLLKALDCQRDFLNRNFTLDLSDNKISQFSKVDLRKVAWLILKNNPLDISEFLRFRNVDPQRVEYSGLRLHSQFANLCQHLGNGTMERLLLQNNQISLHNLKSMSKCPAIKAWDLSHNYLIRDDCLDFVPRKEQVRSFILEHNRIQMLSSCSKGGNGVIQFPKLTYLSYRYNRILAIASHAFSHTAYVQTLLLNINNIAVINKTAFANLSELLTLRLDNNLITDIYQETFRELTSLRTLNLRNNRVSIIFRNVFVNLSSLDILDLGGNKIRSLTNLSFSGLHNLTKLYLDRNCITHISREIFGDLVSLKVLDLAKNWIRYNSGLTEKSPFINLTKLNILKLQAQQPYGINIIPPKFFKGLISLQALYLGENKMSLSKYEFEDLINLKTLSMPDTCNGIHSLNPGVFQKLQHLQRLNLENVGLQFMSVDIFGSLSNLRTLVLGKNAIQTVNSTVLEHLSSLSYLDLRKNPFPCICSNSWFQNWCLSNPRVQVVYFYNQTCANQQTEYLYRFDARVCYLDIGHLMFEIILPFLLLFTFAPIIYGKGYWHIKYGLYIFRSWLNDYRGREESQQCYRYDAFISYNSNDERWVLQELVPNLETEGSQCFKLCLHHRDFELGKYIIDNIVDSIYQSRKTICVMSRNYLESEWCSMELELASYRLFHELKDVVILIFLEKIPEAELSTYHKMRKVTKKKTYIQWPTDVEAQKLFWIKVREAIKGSSRAKDRGSVVDS
ncbi:toll-like receptor 13 [Rhincodon typus]|uniref:toll-like receptor 13 n=1 Tax=Rhincodon typus TaxID=259920 RepID=UPI002030A5C3|nr:toll-like receptor 13 [Rhincodon typus]XP_048476288.1 toll-like receptor 13 [Rhincodon typus]XP_048476289.1 toll-like receptor 13 [Rhincodon typus]XP_048476290.1 toll-like receptor 13 [Rhincodon typus]